MGHRGTVSIGERVRGLRREHAWTQAELAQHAGVHVRAVQNWERGIRDKLAPESLRGLAKAFGISVRELVAGTDMPEPKRGKGLTRPEPNPGAKALAEHPESPHSPPPQFGEGFQPCELIMVGRHEAPLRGLFRVLSAVSGSIVLFQEHS